MLYYLGNNNKKIETPYTFSTDTIILARLHNTHQQQGNIFFQYVLSAIDWTHRYVTCGYRGLIVYVKLAPLETLLSSSSTPWRPILDEDWNLGVVPISQIVMKLVQASGQDYAK